MSASSRTARLAALSEAGVSIWLDDLSRERLVSGSLARDVEHHHIVGVTTNPSIFAAALKGSDAYAAQIAELRAAGADAEAAVRAITTDDVRAAADVLRPVFDATGGVDGRVSIEVDPRLAHDAAGTIAQARELWALVDRPNVLIKIPATVEGLEAIAAVIGGGISVNVTLIFSLERYTDVLEAYMTGLDTAAIGGHELGSIASVASFFVSRVDTEVDKRLDASSAGAAPASGPVASVPVASVLRGTAAIANARLAFAEFERVSATPRWRALREAGARPQRPLWASTGVKDPAYPDTMYVDELVTAGVVNTMPQATIDAFADHGPVPAEPEGWDTVRGTAAESAAVMARLASAGIDIGDVTAQLEREGVDKFVDSWEELLGTVGAALGE